MMPFLTKVNIPIPPPAPGEPARITTTLLGSHPTISTLWATTGRIVNSLEIHGGKVYMAYGDYSRNSGPTEVAYYSIAGASFGSELTAPTEEHDRFRKIDGKLYVPRKDPNPTPGWDGVGGYATDASGSWQNVAGPDMIHTFDVALTGTDFWLVGSSFLSGGATGVAYRSTDGGGSWTTERTLSPGDYSRFESAVVNGGSLYLGTYLGNEIHVYDGSAWTTITGKVGGVPTVASGKVFGNTGWLNGSTVEAFPTAMANVWTDGTSAYGLSATYYVYEAVIGASSFTWSEIGRLPDIYPSSIAVSGSDLYIGTATGSLYKAAGLIV